MAVSRWSAVRCAAVLIVLYPALAAADPPWQVTSADGKSSVSVGFLAQGQAEWLGTADGSSTSKNLFLRRMRLMAGGKINSKVSFFLETDSPNLGKGTTDGKKNQEVVFLQDVILTYTVRPEFQIDAGMLLIPGSHNAEQSAATLLPVDYGPFSFLNSDPTDSRVGRDYGVQARGYILKHVEYRLGAFQGHRDVNALAPFRYVGRVVWYPFEAETGFFYTGTTLGSRRILAVGTSVDHQGDYNTRAVDLFVDQPMNHGDGVTLQADYIRYDGGATFVALPQQDTWLVEAGYYVHQLKVSPFLQVATREFAGGLSAHERRFQAGAAYWANGHRLSLKVGIGRQMKDGVPDRTQANVQMEVFFY